MFSLGNVISTAIEGSHRQQAWHSVVTCFYYDVVASSQRVRCCLGVDGALLAGASHILDAWVKVALLARLSKPVHMIHIMVCPSGCIRFSGCWPVVLAPFITFRFAWCTNFKLCSMRSRRVPYRPAPCDSFEALSAASIVPICG